MGGLSQQRSWNWLDTFLFFVRTLWILYHSSWVLKSYSEKPNVWLVIFFLSVYLVPYIFNRPGYMRIHGYLAAETVLTGSLFVFLNHHFQDTAVYDLLFFPLMTIAYVCQTAPFIWIGPVAWTLIFISGALAGDASMGMASIIERLINVALFYIFGFSLGKVTLMNHRKKLLIQSIEEKNRTLEQYSKRIEELTINEERHRVSQDLHDTVGHVFTSVITSLDALPYVMKADKQEAERYVKEISLLARQGLDDVRNTIHQLSPDKEENSLADCLQDISNDFMKHTGTQVEVEIDGVEHTVSEELKETLMRCMQESLTNAKRHGQASAIKVALTFGRHNLLMRIKDNGTGTDHLVTGFGLRTMMDRITVIGGSLDIHSSVTYGTELTFAIPLRNKPVPVE
ncbi:sensor histidine kinase [Peribacillus sp. SCS-155]|uniref:sensor histidine kinase n=1 Tax=Peribacillus sedimenti TaxID=3115297 RepID=UPI0039068579